MDILHIKFLGDSSTYQGEIIDGKLYLTDGTGWKEEIDTRSIESIVEKYDLPDYLEMTREEREEL